jgi:predicted NACHT family NTPase
MREKVCKLQENLHKMEKSEIAKNVITMAMPLVTAITNVFVKPKIVELAKTLDIKKKNFEHIIENKFNQYLIKSYEKYSIINTIVFHNQQKLLKELYIPLAIENTDNNKFEIENFDDDCIPFFQRILITDTAGMGKSTILKRLFLSIVDEEKGIPVLIELRRLSKTKDIIDEIIEQLSTITEIPDKKFVLQLIQKGDFIFLLDGFDEIPLENRKIITKQIQTFVNKAGNNFFVMTSRPETALSSFDDFKEFQIIPLIKEQAFTLLKKYDNAGVLAPLLIKKLKEKQYENIDEFLTNPLLVSLLFAAFEHKQTIPLKKHIFYRQVFDALFESHDLTKGDSFIREKFSKLDIDEFHKVLRHLGYNCLINSKIEFTKDEILNLITEAKDFSAELQFKESDFLKDLINTVPLFTIDGIYYKWSHKSLQEYFAAQFIFLDSKDCMSSN